VELRYNPSPGRHIAPRAQDVTAGTTVLTASTRLGPPQIAAAAAAGAATVSVHRRPTVSVLATGSELVPADVKPTGGQIRNSNTSYLMAALRQLGLQPVSLGIVSDDRELLRDHIRQGLRADVLLTTGGISMGRHDLIPGLLAESGVTFHIRKVAVRPGKPTIFGTHHEGKLVFALPGNPVSCFVGLWFLAAPALAGLEGAPVRFPAGVQAVTDQPLAATGDRETFIPARTSAAQDGKLHAKPISWSGSGDPFGLARADSLIVRPAGPARIPAGGLVRVVPLEHPWPQTP
jgi:molybdopterin molybdotransferase